MATGRGARRLLGEDLVEHLLEGGRVLGAAEANLAVDLSRCRHVGMTSNYLPSGKSKRERGRKYGCRRTYQNPCCSSLKSGLLGTIRTVTYQNISRQFRYIFVCI